MVKAYSGNNQLTAIPFTLGFRALYYNKDIFDKFAVAYPKAKMSWEDTIALARMATRVDGGVQYYGMGMSIAPYLPMRLALSLPFVDAKANKAAVNTAEWKNVFELAQQFYQIPGNQEALTGAMNNFTKDKTLAMMVGNNALRNMVGLNWDVTSVPTMKEDPNNGGEAIGQTLAVTAQSKNKEAAFLIIANALSDDVQTTLVKSGRPSALKASKYVDDFGKGMSNVTNQHLTEILQVNFKTPVSTSKYDAFAETTLTKWFNESVTKGTDSNSVLLGANDEIDKYIQTDLSGKK
jgi:multiple sugar transport system substrate-binding protein